MRNSPAPFPPTSPSPMRVNRSWPSKKRRSNCGMSGTILTFTCPSHPAAIATGLGHSADPDHVGGVAHEQLPLPRQLAHGDVGRRHLEIQLPQHFVLLPEVVRVGLHLLEVAAGDPAG